MVSGGYRGRPSNRIGEKRAEKARHRTRWPGHCAGTEATPQPRSPATLPNPSTPISLAPTPLAAFSFLLLAIESLFLFPIALYASVSPVTPLWWYLSLSLCFGTSTTGNHLTSPSRDTRPLRRRSFTSFSLRPLHPSRFLDASFLIGIEVLVFSNDTLLCRLSYALFLSTLLSIPNTALLSSGSGGCFLWSSSPLFFGIPFGLSVSMDCF